MKLLLLISAISLSISSTFAQCSVTVNDSLYLDYSYVLNATNVVGQAPFQFNWTVTDGNGVPVQYTQNPTGDSITIPAQIVQNAYGCIVYELCMTDALMCTTCSGDTSELQVTFPCYSAFNSSMVGPNQIAITVYNDIPPFILLQQFMQWTDGDGQSQGMPYSGPGTVMTYTPGSQNPSDKFLLCVMSLLTTGGCLSCDSIPYSMLNVDEMAIELNLSPNPANTQIKINSKGSIDRVSILNLGGMVVYKEKVGQVNELIVQTASIPNGIYFVEIQSGDAISRKKFSVQH